MGLFSFKPPYPLSMRLVTSVCVRGHQWREIEVEQGTQCDLDGTNVTLHSQLCVMSSLGTQALFLPLGIGYIGDDFCSIFSITSLPFTCPLKAGCRKMSGAMTVRVGACGGGSSAGPIWAGSATGLTRRTVDVRWCAGLSMTGQA